MADYKQLLSQINELKDEKNRILQTMPSLEDFPKIEEDEELDRKVKRLMEINEELDKLEKQLIIELEHEDSYYSIYIMNDGVAIYEQSEESGEEEVFLPYPVLHKLIAWLREMGVLSDGSSEEVGA